MQNIIDKLNNSLSQKDLFQFWQEELGLRQQARSGDEDWDGVLIQNLEDFHFIKRALYYGDRQNAFLALLYRNISSADVQEWLLQDSPALMSAFLNYLCTYINDKNPPHRDMQFLINIYREEFQADFQKLIAEMDSSLCSHLLSRTTNNHLRQLFKARQGQIAQEGQREHYGLISPHQFIADYPTIFGDKVEIMTNAIKSLKLSQTLNLESSPRPDFFEALLDGADLLFRAGLLPDCLALIAELLASEPDMDQLLRGEKAILHRINQLLRKALPMYTLLVNPGDPHRYALELLRSRFPGFKPDHPSLLYLDLYTIVLAGLQGYHRYPRYELAQIAARIISYRPEDPFASLLLKPGDNLNGVELSFLQGIIDQRLPTQPHESLVIMEMLRLWQFDGTIALNRDGATYLLQDYLHIFKWIPATTFINKQLLEQLGPIADKASRGLAEQIIEINLNWSSNWPTNQMPGRELSSQEDRDLRKKLLLGKYMGVF